MFQYDNNTATETIFLHSKMDLPHTSQDKRYRIIITPEYYIVKKISLSVKFKAQAMQMASAALEDFITKDREYKYFCFKGEDNEWVFIAYSLEQINDLLESKNIDRDAIEGIYFAQELSQVIDKPLPINSGCSLGNIDGIIVCLPHKNSLISDREINTIKLKHKIFSGPLFSPDIPLKKLIVASLVFFIWGIVLLIQTHENTKQTQDNIERYNAALKNQELPDNSYTASNLLSKYSEIDKKQSAIRDSLSDLDTLLDDKIKIKEIILSGKEIQTNFEVEDEESIKSFEKRAKKIGFLVQKSSTEHKMILKATKAIE